MESYQTTGLWQRSLGAQGQDEDKLAILRATYVTMRTRAGHITAQIAKALPSLTIHDVTHLDALWETADLIAGPDYPLNPLEGFVLGGAILLHDSALCFEAYEGGRDGLRSSLEWKDAFFSAQSDSPGIPLAELEDTADFAAMRALHARRASQLGEAYWTTPEGDQLHIIENFDLRKHFGKIIGEIAASHHWPIEDVQSKLPPQINAPGTMPKTWRVDPVKIACLLRCADAAHIDSRRAPDFLRALTKRQGLSADHWTSQNWLERADVDLSDSDARSMLITSAKAFDEGHADAWWVTFDALRLIDKELSSSAELLSQRPQSRTSPPFQLRQVTGAASPVIASKSIRVEGWSPQSVEVHLGNVERLIANLGGEKLYGTSQTLCVVIREVVQNARDAVVARRHMDFDYEGIIRISLLQEGGDHIITIEDDGVGMSHRVITGTLLDFGTSFWASQIVQKEFPGLRSSGYKSVGQFGIGFYSIFMVAKSVSVSSRRFDSGLESATRVKFPNGLSLRPIISRGNNNDLKPWASTKVSINLKDEFGDPSRIQIQPGRVGYTPEERLSIENCLSILCAGLDVSIDLIDLDGKKSTIHRPLKEISTDAEKSFWLTSIIPSVSSQVSPIVAQYAPRLRHIKRGDGKVIGLAALSFSRDPARETYGTVMTVGGLASAIGKSDLSRFVGCLDYEPNSAKREPSGNPDADHIAIENWAHDQIKLLPPRIQASLEWCYASMSLSDLHVDPYQILTILVREKDNVHFHTLETLAPIMIAKGIALYVSSQVSTVELHHREGSYQDYPTYLPLENSALNHVPVEGEVIEKTSLISCFSRHASTLGMTLERELIPSAADSVFGKMHVLLLRYRPSAILAG